ncbi:MAG: hypothetical protein ACT6RL_07070 [Neoaquamicrobium sediminum]|uniref:Uncharacterized protein n=1 Tax=Neoaquamicrobium sediminum TaxID=1849104 RepID=A0ABV3WNJ6_9HYPH
MSYGNSNRSSRQAQQGAAERAIVRPRGSAFTYLIFTVSVVFTAAFVFGLVA